MSHISYKGTRAGGETAYLLVHLIHILILEILENILNERMYVTYVFLPMPTLAAYKVSYIVAYDVPYIV